MLDSKQGSLPRLPRRTSEVDTIRTASFATERLPPSKVAIAARARAESFNRKHEIKLREQKVDRGHSKEDELALEVRRIKDECSQWRIESEAKQGQIARLKSEAQKLQEEIASCGDDRKTLAARVAQLGREYLERVHQVEVIRQEQRTLELMQSTRSNDSVVLRRLIQKLKAQLEKYRIQLKRTALQVKEKVNHKLDLERRLSELDSQYCEEKERKLAQVKGREDELCNRDEFEESKQQRLARQKAVGFGESRRLQSLADEKLRCHVRVQQFASLVLSEKIAKLDADSQEFVGLASRIKLQVVDDREVVVLPRDFFRLPEQASAAEWQRRLQEARVKELQDRVQDNRRKLIALQTETYRLEQEKVAGPELNETVTRRSMGREEGEASLRRVELWAEKSLRLLGIKYKKYLSRRLQSVKQAVLQICESTRAGLCPQAC